MAEREELEFKGTLASERAEYPIVVTRWIPAVYGVRPVRFVTERPSTQDRDNFVLVEPRPYDGGHLTAACLTKQVEAVIRESQKCGFKMCIVLGAEEAIYVDPDGRTFRSTSPPGGGLRFDAKRKPPTRRGRAMPRKGGAE